MRQSFPANVIDESTKIYGGQLDLLSGSAYYLSSFGLVPNGSIDATGGQVAEFLDYAITSRGKNFLNQTSAGSPNTIILNSDIAGSQGMAFQSLKKGMVIQFEITYANTSNCTINVDSIGAVALNNISNSALVANDLLPGFYSAIYNGTNFILTSSLTGKSFITRHLLGKGSNGAVLTYNSTSLLNFEALEAYDSINTVQIITNSTVIKNISSNFVAGSGNGGKFFAGVLTNTFYPCFVISNASGSLIDFGIDDNASCSNIPSGYTKYRLIGYIYINSSLQIKKFFQNGCIGYFETTYDSGFLDRANSSLSSTRTLKTLSVPPNTTAKLVCQEYHGGVMVGTYYYYIRQTNATDFIPSINDNDGRITTPGSAQQDNQDHLTIQTDSSSQVALRSSDANLYLGIITLGYIQQF